MALFVTCSNCRAQSQAPPGATAIRCPYCYAVTSTAPNHHFFPPPPRPLYPPMVGRKKALICGINYKGSNAPLEGCINDAKCMKYLLINKFKFPESGIIMLTEEEKNPNKIPTKRNIQKAMAWLVAGVRAGDSLVFHFSGHGLQQKVEDDYDEDGGDEEDGFNETLCPLDFETNGDILDDEINNTLVKPIPRGAKLTAIIDSCHSGTILDLPYLCRINRRGKCVWEDHFPRPGIWKGTSGGEAICISGCDDHQVSDETPNEDTTGAMSYSFIQAIEKGHASTYGSLLNAMKDVLRDVRKKKVDNGVVLTLPTQIPQLCANEPFEAYAKPFTL